MLYEVITPTGLIGTDAICPEVIAKAAGDGAVASGMFEEEETAVWPQHPLNFCQSQFRLA